MPTSLPCTNRWLEWCGCWVWSSMQADLCHSRWWHWAAEGTSQSWLRQGVSYLLEICHSFYTIESGAAAMCAVQTINAVQNFCWPQKQPQKHPSQCQNCTCQHPPGCDNCPAWESVWRGCLKKEHWQAKCHSSKKNQSTTPVENQSKGMPGQHGRKEKKADLIGVHTEEPPCDEIFLDDVHVQQWGIHNCLPTCFC